MTEAGPKILAQIRVKMTGTEVIENYLNTLYFVKEIQLLAARQFH